MLDSRKMPSPRKDARNWAPRRLVTHPASVIHWMKPSTPPERWVSAMSEPMSALNMIVRVFPSDLYTSTRAWIASPRPRTMLPPSMMIQESQMPANRERNTCLVTSAVTIASRGGNTLSHVGPVEKSNVRSVVWHPISWCADQFYHNRGMIHSRPLRVLPPSSVATPCLNANVSWLSVSANAINKDVGMHTKVSLNVRHRVVSPDRIAERTASPEIRLKL